jgi:hypothetical protein
MYSKADYQSLLMKAKNNGYRFLNFLDLTASSSKSIFLRLDVNLSPTIALELAQVNHSLGIRGNFFFPLREEKYNALAPENQNAIRKIHDLEQNIGFSYVLLPERSIDHTLAVSVRDDFDILSRYIPEMQKIFVWSASNPELIAWGVEHQVAGLVNIENQLALHGIPNVSDEALGFSTSQLTGLLAERSQSMQLILHPHLWLSSTLTYLAELRYQLENDVAREMLDTTDLDFLAPPNTTEQQSKSDSD